MFFTDLERILKEKIPVDIVQILSECGFDTRVSISCITPDTIKEIEEYVNVNPSILSNTSYNCVSNFKLKPGHISYILNLPNRMKQFNCDGKEECKMSDFSHMLRAFVKAAENNFGKHPNGFRYNDSCRYFSTFIYLMSGRACYETLSANLPIPEANTICKYKFSFTVLYKSKYVVQSKYVVHS